MTEISALPFFKRRGKPGARSSERVRPIEIVAPDRHSTDLLLKHAASVFPAELLFGPAWVVRLHPPSGGKWVLDLFALVERWLESASLPRATVLYGGRSYLILASTGGFAQFAAAESASARDPRTDAPGATETLH